MHADGIIISKPSTAENVNIPLRPLALHFLCPRYRFRWMTRLVDHSQVGLFKGLRVIWEHYSLIKSRISVFERRDIIGRIVKVNIFILFYQSHEYPAMNVLGWGFRDIGNAKRDAEFASHANIYCLLPQRQPYTLAESHSFELFGENLPLQGTNPSQDNGENGDYSVRRN